MIRRCLGVVIIAIASSISAASEIDFRESELPTKLTVGYAVRLIDMNDDERLDIVIVDSKRLLWLENPNWDEHVMLDTPSQQHDNVCFAPNDIDGDGRLDFALGADWQFGNTESGGTIGWISPGKTVNDLWTYHAIGEEPTTHRMQFADIDADGKDELVVAPLKGRDTTGPDFNENGVRLLSYEVPKDPVNGKWVAEVITDELRVMHNFWPVRKGGKTRLLTASFEGVNALSRRDDGTWGRVHLGTGDQESSPNRGASEIKSGKLGPDHPYIATIEPWHGDKVVVYTMPDTEYDGSGEWLWKRQVLDDQLKWGHAVWCANLDGDDAEELIIGVRDDLSDEHRRGLRIYDPQDDAGSSWKRTVIDPGSVAVEDLAAADLNGDGRVDIVAVGRQTHNVKIYWNETK
ncbi:MAG: VCBS repeat-containing protein [Planctomycetaceae bacterium]|nr:VCBS repeat-containing protein [Planctomycetaceae bacterium]